jgi:hypothetical protein
VRGSNSEAVQYPLSGSGDRGQQRCGTVLPAFSVTAVAGIQIIEVLIDRWLRALMAIGTAFPK